MERVIAVMVSLTVMAGGILIPAAARAQQAPGGIAGVVKDTSGAVLPGVTVEASSPALIEKVRSVVSDGQGQYKIVDLRSGTYTVTFTLPGFNTLKREGIELTTGFTASVSVDMPVGAVEETLTVTGASPLVDTQNVRQQKVVSSELLQVLPTSTKGLVSLTALIPGMIPRRQEPMWAARGASTTQTTPTQATGTTARALAKCCSTACGSVTSRLVVIRRSWSARRRCRK